MLKLFRRKKLTQHVARVEDLQIGDLIQIDLESRATIRNIYEWKNDLFELKLAIEANHDHPIRHRAIGLHRDQQVFVWK